MAAAVVVAAAAAAAAAVDPDFVEVSSVVAAAAGAWLVSPISVQMKHLFPVSPLLPYQSTKSLVAERSWGGDRVKGWWWR